MRHQLRMSPDCGANYSLTSRLFLNRTGRSAIIALFVIVLLHLESLEQVLMAGNGEQSSAGCHMRELELCSIGTASIFQNPNGLPANGAELKRQCEFLEESADCFDDYAERCLTGQQSMLVSFLKASPVELSRAFCTNGSDVNVKYLKHVTCYREIQTKHQRECLLDLQVGLEGIHKLEHSLRLPTACCNLNRMKECIFPKIEEQCGEEALELSVSMLELSFSSLASNLCRNYDPFNATCESLLPEIGTKPHTGRNVSAISRILMSYTNIQSSSS